MVIPYQIVAAVGSTVRVKCKYSDSAAWSFEGGDLPLNAHFYSSRNERSSHLSLSIRDLKPENEGFYTCYTSNIYLLKVDGRFVWPCWTKALKVILLGIQYNNTLSGSKLYFNG